MKKFEYKQEKVWSATFEEKLNELGSEGWELVQYESGIAYLKREIIPAKPSTMQLLNESYKIKG